MGRAARPTKKGPGASGILTRSPTGSASECVSFHLKFRRVRRRGRVRLGVVGLAGAVASELEVLVVLVNVMPERGRPQAGLLILRLSRLLLELPV